MKVKNMISAKGNKAANQFIIEDTAIKNPSDKRKWLRGDMFQSYNSNIAFISRNGKTFIDEYYWDYSVTTGKYRNMFLNETKKETEKKIKSGVYKLVNLN